MLMKVDAVAKISDEERTEIEEEMSREMGAFIMSIGETDFAQWSPQQWKDLVGIAFEHAALGVFTKRIMVTKPYTVYHSDDPPF